MPAVVDLTGKDTAADSGSKSDGKPKVTQAARKRAEQSDSDLRARLETVFDRIADAADARGDDELATAVREDLEVMATGLVNLTKPFKALRRPIVGALAVVEPFMAFGRVGRLLFGRALDRRRQPTDSTPETDGNGSH